MTTQSKKGYCFVPQCTSTKKKNPEKLFFKVPNGEDRKKWCQKVRGEVGSLITPLWCCEDHFSLEDDVQDWFRYKFLKESQQPVFRLKLLKNVLPHKFDCQRDRPTSHTKPPRQAVLKRQKIEERKALADLTDLPQHSDESINLSTITCADSSIEGIDVLSTDLANIEEMDQMDSNEVVEPKYKEIGIQCDLLVCDAESKQEESIPHCCSQKPSIEMKEMATQVEDDGFLELFNDLAVGNAVGNDYMDLNETFCSNATEFSVADTADSSFHLDESCLSSYSDHEFDDEDVIGADLKERMASVMNEVMLRYPKDFIGIDPENMCVIEALERFTNCSQRNILIVLRKIRLDESIEMLGIYFGLSRSSISRIISDTCPKIAAYLCSLIKWPEQNIIRANVPYQFKANFSNVEVIIDCLEIHIQQFSDSEYQSQTWSDYKKNNTVKYLIGSTPDGHIIFISPGFGGRTSDQQIVLNSGFLDKLRKGTVVMADRGFKNVETELHRRGCSLVRPPSVSTDTKMSEDEVSETKVIASLRILIERVIRRLRAFSLVEPRACSNHNILRYINHAVIIACALSNVQGPFFL